MFSVENYTMDRAERYTQRKEPYNRYLQEAVRRTVHPYHTHGEYHTMITAGGGAGCPHTASSLPFGERTEEFPRADESPTLTRENSISLKVSIVQYDLFF